ncbi:MAG: cyclic nucleotide-binding domain-containing protein, partial [Pseudomonadota bacterium]
MALSAPLTHFLVSVHPFDSLSEAEVTALAEQCSVKDYAPGDAVFGIGDQLSQLCIIAAGEVEIRDNGDVPISLLGPRNTFGERALLRGSAAQRVAKATVASTVVFLPSEAFFKLIETSAVAARFF